MTFTKYIKFLSRFLVIAVIAIMALKYVAWAVSPDTTITKRLHPTFEWSELWIFSNNEPRIDHKYLQIKKKYEEEKLTLYDRQQNDIHKFEEFLVNTKSKSIAELKQAVEAAKSSPARKYVNGLFIPILKSRIAKRSES